MVHWHLAAAVMAGFSNGASCPYVSLAPSNASRLLVKPHAADAARGYPV